MTGTYIWDGRGWVEPSLFHARKPKLARSDLPAPAVRADGMSDTWNPADGNTYDSKSAYHRAVKDAGCEINEAPPEAPTMKAPVGVGADIKDAIDQLEAR